MWRLIRIIQKNYIGDGTKVQTTIDSDCLNEFMGLTTFVRHRNYTRKDALLAYSMGIDYGYILNDGKLIGDEKQRVLLSGDGFMFASPTGLANALAKSVAQVGSLTTVIIAALALGVSIYAIHQKPAKPTIIVVQSNDQKTTSPSVIR